MRSLEASLSGERKRDCGCDVMGQDDQQTTVRGGERGRPGPSQERGTFAKGHVLGRYVVLELLGRGATSSVYRAYDPELDRSVALKVLEGPGWAGVDGKSQLLHEARALARLSHRNVAAVYEVATADEASEEVVFLAMESIEGHDLAAWVSAESPSWQRRLDVLLQVARGLEAVHAAGVLHRDIKPANVRVMRDGRVVLVDFGLAHPSRTEDASTSEGLFAAAARQSSTSSSVRVPARPAGTPAYLAPELYDGHPVDERSDIFAYCVTAWETLFETPPWPDEAAPDAEAHAMEEALLRAKRQGPPPPPKHSAPPRVGQLLVQGLAPDPDARVTSMQTIVATLETTLQAVHHSPRWRWPMLTLAVVAATAIGAAAGRGEPCDDAAVRAQQVWNEATKQRARDGLASSGAPHADEAWQHAEREIEAHIERWTRAHTDACEATHVRDEQSDAMLDRRMICLDRQLEQLRMLLEVFAAADATVTSEASAAASRLPDATACSREAVEARREHADDPVTRVLREQLDRVAVLESAGRYEQALAELETTRGSIEQREAEALLIEARYLEGRLLERRGKVEQALSVLRQVHWDAEAHALDELAARAGTYVVFILAAVLHRADEALSWTEHVDASVRRAGDRTELRAALIEHTGTAHLTGQRPAEALAQYERALVLRESVDDSLGLLSTLNSLGIVLEEMHRYADAQRMHERALQLAIRIVGPHHLHTARSHDNLGTTLQRQEQFAAATEHMQRALQIRVEHLGEHHRLVGISRHHLGVTELLAGDPAAAIRHLEAALAISEASGDTTSLQIHEALAHALASLGRTPEARHHARVALEGLRARLPEDHPEIEGLQALLRSEP